MATLDECKHNFVNGQCTECKKFDFAGTFADLFSDDALENNAKWQAELADVRAEMLENADLGMLELLRSMTAEEWYQ